MIESVWIAFACGLFIGSCLGILGLALISAGKSEELMRDNERLRQTRQLLKEEIFRIEKNYKPRKLILELTQNQKKLNQNLMNIDLLLEIIIVLE